MNKTSTWKLYAHLAGFFLCFAIGGAISAIPRMIVGFEKESSIIVFFSEMARIFITIAFLVLYAKHVLKKPEINSKLLRIRVPKPILWLLIGLLLPCLLIFSLVKMRFLNVNSINFELPLSSIFSGLLISVSIAVASGILEELTFRGYIMETFKLKYGFWLSGIIPSTLFAIIHLGGAGSVLNAVQVLTGGILVSVLFLSIYKVTRSIWNLCIVHACWNFVILNKLIHIGGDTMSISDRLITFQPIDNILLSGGDFGIEVSLNAFLIYTITAFTIMFFYYKKKK